MRTIVSIAVLAALALIIIIYFGINLAKESPAQIVLTILIVGGCLFLILTDKKEKGEIR